MDRASSGSSWAPTNLRQHELKRSDLTPNCLTYLLPPQDPLSDRQTRKTLILRKVNDWPLLFEDIAANTYFEAGYFTDPPPKLNIRAGPQPKRPEALRDLESRAVGFCFKALIALDSGFRLGGADIAWPCYLVSDVQEMIQPMKHIIPARPRSLYSHEYSNTPDHSHHSAKKLRTGQSIEPPVEQPVDYLSETNKLREEVAVLKQEITQLQHVVKEPPDYGEEVRLLRQEVKSLKQQISTRSETELDLEALEAGYERLLRTAYEEWRMQLNVVEENAASIMRTYRSEIDELKAQLRKLKPHK